MASKTYRSWVGMRILETREKESMCRLDSIALLACTLVRSRAGPAARSIVLDGVRSHVAFGLDANRRVRFALAVLSCTASAARHQSSRCSVHSCVMEAPMMWTPVVRVAIYW